MKRPSFQFYPGDWRNNAKLRRCSVAAQGAWINVLCLMHDSDEYGVLRWPLAEIAHAAGLPPRLLQELADKGVMKGSNTLTEPFTFAPSHAGRVGPEVVLVKPDGGPCWYCSRLVRDEEIRQRRGLATRFDPAPNPTPNPAPMPPFGSGFGSGFGDGPSSSSSSSSKTKPSRRKRADVRAGGYPPDFEILWSAYPKRQGGNSKADAWTQYQAQLRQGETAEAMLAGVQRYAAFVKAEGNAGTRFVKQASTFLGRGLHFREPWAVSGGDGTPGNGIDNGAML
jgi:hypothetical protein